MVICTFPLFFRYLIHRSSLFSELHTLISHLSTYQQERLNCFFCSFKIIHWVMNNLCLVLFYSSTGLLLNHVSVSRKNSSWILLLVTCTVHPAQLTMTLGSYMFSFYTYFVNVSFNVIVISLIIFASDKFIPWLFLRILTIFVHLFVISISFLKAPLISLFWP